MFESKREPAKAGAGPARTTRQVAGDGGEARALAYLQQQGLKLVERNYRVARGPSRRAGEVDLIMRDRDGTLVFVEVRVRAAGLQAGGAAASVTATKQRSLVHAAQHYLMRLPTLPPCRFDVVAIDGAGLQWLRAAFDLG